jgi:hypothetical protein
MNVIPIGRILLRDVYVRITQNNTPAIVTVGFIVVFVNYCHTTCFGPHGPSSGEYNTLTCCEVVINNNNNKTYSCDCWCIVLSDCYVSFKMSKFH